MSAEIYGDQMDGDGRVMMTRKRFSGRKFIAFIIIPLVLLAGIGAAVYYSGVLNHKTSEVDESVLRNRGPVQIVYYDLPDLLVNLRTDGPRPSFLKMSVSLELEHIEDRQYIDKIMPRVIDTFQVYLRELRPDQLQGSAGILRLREELLTRVNAVAKPAQVKDVLFKEMLVQ